VAAGDVARFGALAAALAILVGLVLALLGLLHMGFVSGFISAGVQAGFMFGLGLTIIVGQVPKLLGVPKGDGDFFPQLVHLLTRLDDTNAWTAAIGLGSSVLGRLPGTGAWVAVDHEPDARTEPGLLVFRLDAPLLFINAKPLRDRLRALLDAARPPVRIVLLDLQFTHDLDVESVNVLAALHAELAGRGVALWLGNVRAGAREVLRRSGLAAAVGEARLYRTLADAAPDLHAALDA
jgi:MFS superfamily sulfate permease-like transporter